MMTVLSYLKQKGILLQKGVENMPDAYTLQLTNEERQRLGIIVAAHIDLTLTPELNAAARNKQTERVLSLTDTIRLERGILAKL